MKSEILKFSNWGGDYASQSFELRGKTFDVRLVDHRIIGEGFKIRIGTISPTKPNQFEQHKFEEGIKTLKEAKKLAQKAYEEFV